MQSLQNQFVKAVDADGVHTIVPYIKITTCIHSLRHLQNFYIYKCKRKQLINAVRTSLTTKVYYTMLPHGIMGNGIMLVFIRSIMAI